MVKVLYVEDEPAQRELVNQLLLLAGVEVKLADNGLDGVEKVQSWRPDVILMDLRMPGLSGFEAIEKIRNTPGVEDTPIVILSAWTGAKLDAKAAELGVNRCITKPFDLEELVNTIMAVSTQS